MGEPLRLLVDGVDRAPVRVADTYLSRLRGLLGKARVDVPLLLTDCRSVHGAFMLVRLDVAFLARADGDADREASGGRAFTVVATRRLVPFAVLGPRRGAEHVLEAGHHEFARWGLRAGSTVVVRPASGPAGGC